MSKIQKNRYSDIILLFLLYILISILLFFMSRKYIGPAIFGDELTYFNLARQLHERGEWHMVQYNILYPAITSLAFFAEKTTLTYDIIKVMNILLYASSIFPAYLLSKKVIGNRVINIGLAIVITLLPRTGTVLVIWAEPLFYMISLWAAYSFLCFFEAKTLSNIIKLSIAGLLLYLAKQAGIIFLISVLLVLLLDCLRNKKEMKINLLTGLFAIFPILIYMAWNKLKGESAIGYSGALSAYRERFELLAYLKCFIYQINDLFLMSFLLFGILFFAGFLMMKNEKKEIKALYAMTLFWTMGIVALSALHRSSGLVLLKDQAGALTYGRYTCIVLPFILIFGLKLLLDDKVNAKGVLLGMLPILVSQIIFNPLEHEVYSYGYISSFGCSYMSSIVHGTTGVYWHKEPVPIIYVIGQLAFFFVLSILLLHNNIKIKRVVLVIVALFSIWTGIETVRLVGSVYGGTNPLHEVYRFLIDSHIELNDVYVSEETLDSVTRLRNESFWYGEEMENGVSYEDAKYQLSIEVLEDKKAIFENTRYYLYDLNLE